jgi:hypothetical protein
VTPPGSPAATLVGLPRGGGAAAALSATDSSEPWACLMCGKARVAPELPECPSCGAVRGRVPKLKQVSAAHTTPAVLSISVSPAPPRSCLPG